VAIESEQGKRYPAFFYFLINVSRAIGCRGARRDFL